MKIVHILASLGSGGIQGFVFSLAYEQSKLGHEVMIVVTEVCDNDHSLMQENILKENGVVVVRLNRHLANKKETLITLFRCRWVVSRFHPDVVNSHATMWHLYGAIACALKPYNQVCTIHNTPERWSWIVRLLCGRKPIICCSKSAYDGRLQKNKRVIAIPNGISPELVRTIEIVDLRKECGLPETTKVVVSVGNMRPAKNYNNLVTLAQILEKTDIHFFICGGNHGGPAYDDPTLYEGFSHLHCVGTRSDVSAIENAADLFLSSSIFEGLPIAVLEAYFNGIPCVLSPIVQHKDIAEMPMVWIPKDFSPEAFVNSIKEAITVTSTHDEIYEARRPYLEKYSITRTAREYMAFYQECIN